MRDAIVPKTQSPVYKRGNKRAYGIYGGKWQDGQCLQVGNIVNGGQERLATVVAGET